MEAQERTRDKLARAIKEEMEHTSLDKICLLYTSSWWSRTTTCWQKDCMSLLFRKKSGKRRR